MTATLSLAGAGAAAVYWTGVALTTDPTALARVELGPLAGALASARAVGAAGEPIRLTIRGGQLIPQARLTPGEQVSIVVIVRRPSWLSWALGRDRRTLIKIRTPVANVSARWLTRPAGSAVRVAFDRPVVSIGYGTSGQRVRRELNSPRRVILVDTRTAVGSLEVAAAARTWERLGQPVRVSWFPPAALPVLITSPGPGARITPLTPIRLTFSRPVAEVLGSTLPTISPITPGHWKRIDSHSVVFLASGLGVSLGTEVSVRLPHAAAVSTGSARPLHTTRLVQWTVPPASTLWLQQLLAQAGYLPLDWTPAGSPVTPTRRAELQAAIEPPSGHFDWGYPNIPPELRSLWIPGQPNQITRGAVMMFEHDHRLAVDGFAGPDVWSALIGDLIGGKRRSDGYSYVYVHRQLPQSLNLWHNGQTVLSSPGNTGVPAAPTQLGTFPVFEHIPVGTMSGRNPNGSRYVDPGIRYISYFHGGDAIHAFNRASFGTPQSLGCVELPLASAEKVWPYTPIGTLVTIEN